MSVSQKLAPINLKLATVYISSLKEHVTKMLRAVYQ